MTHGCTLQRLAEARLVVVYAGHYRDVAAGARINGSARLASVAVEDHDRFDVGCIGKHVEGVRSLGITAGASAPEIAD